MSFCTESSFTPGEGDKELKGCLILSFLTWGNREEEGRKKKD
jgi:hypothetical protein